MALVLSKVVFLHAIALSLVTAVVNAGTVLQVCHTGGPRVFAAVYETYQGILSGYKVEGWWILETGQCMKEVIYSRDVRAYAFATINGQGQFVALPFDFNLSGPMFARSTQSFCVPVQEKLASFTLTSASVAGVTPPCREDQISLKTSFNILGGDADQRTRMNVRAPNVLPPPEPTYAKIWEERFGMEALEREAMKNKEKRELARAEQSAEMQKAERRRKRQQANQAKEAFRERNDAFKAGTAEMRVLALKKKAPAKEVIAYFSHPDFGCSGLSEIRKSLNSMTKAKVSEMCAEFERIYRSPEYNEEKEDIASVRLDAWNVDGFGWPELSLCPFLSVYSMNSFLLERLDQREGSGSFSCDKEILRGMKSDAGNAIGLYE